jgi:glycosyltransferase involved in cell wall biosynthesis
MSLVGEARKLVRALPVDPRLVHRLRRAAGAGFEAAAFLRYGKDRRATPPQAGPVAVVGFHGSVLGLGEGARAFSAALRGAGLEVIDWDISGVFGHERRLYSDAVMHMPEQASSLVVHLNPRELVQLVAVTGPGPFLGRFCVGYWAWELEQAPPAWRAGLRYVDEVWAPSRFAADAVSALAGVNMPVRVFPHPIALCRGPAGDRARFDLAPNQTVVLTAFDMRSGFARKNPIGAVRAFRAAAARAQVPALLICKATGVEGDPALFAELQAEIGGKDDVRLIADWLSGTDMAALLAAADIVLSLHRSEGFGLLLAQAMCAKKPVVATGWSGNLEFMSDTDSALVDYRLVPVQDPQNLYRGGRWAEPDMDDAVVKLAALMADPDMRRVLGERAAADVAPRVDPVRLGLQARAWLGQDLTAGGTA